MRQKYLPILLCGLLALLAIGALSYLAQRNSSGLQPDQAGAEKPDVGTADLLGDPGSTQEPSEAGLEDLAGGPPAGVRNQAEGLSSAWQIKGHARLGKTGSLRNTELNISVHPGRGTSAAPIAKHTLTTDAEGNFEWVTHDPDATVTVQVLPVIEDHACGEDKRMVVKGDPGPQDLEPYAYPLDSLVQGKVLDVQGMPLAGVEIFTLMAKVQTDSEGLYGIPVFANLGSVTLKAFKPGFAMEEVTVGGLQPGELSAPDMTLRSALSVTGTVGTKTGEPIPGARISLYPADRFFAFSDDAGRFQVEGLDPKAKRVPLSASKRGFLRKTKTVKPSNSEDGAPIEVDIVLEQGTFATGKVIDHLGNPVANATVNWGVHPNPRSPRTVYTDDMGAFSVGPIEAGKRSIWAKGPGLTLDFVRVDVPEPPAKMQPIEIVLSEGYSFMGRVVDENQAPIHAALIFSFIEGASNSDSEYYAAGGASTDAEGRFAFVNVRQPTITVGVFADGYERFEQTIAHGEEVTLNPQRSGGLAGIVVDGITGTPIDSFVVQVVPAELKAGDKRLPRMGNRWPRMGVSFKGGDGAWETGKESLIVGTVTGIDVRAEGYAPTTVRRAVVTPKTDTEPIRIKMYAGTTIQGYVVEASSGSPVANARIRRSTNNQFGGLGLDNSIETRSGPDGSFRLHGIPAGPMNLIVDETSLPNHIDGPFEVPQGSKQIERAIALPEGSSLSGNFLNSDGKAIAGKTIYLGSWDWVTEGILSYTQRSGTDGSFSFKDVMPGRYWLRGEANFPVPMGGFGSTHLIRIEQETPLVYDLQPKGQSTLRGTLGFDGNLPDSCVVKLLRIAESASGFPTIPTRIEYYEVRENRFTATHLEPGEWTASVVVDTPDGKLQASTSVQVPASGEITAHIELVRD